MQPEITTYFDKCYICGKVTDIARIEKHPVTRTERKYCWDCFRDNCTQCEICDDSFVEIGWHNQENRANGAQLV